MAWYEYPTYTNSSLACARRCLRQYDLRYNLRLVAAGDEEREALAVGEAWHKAHHAWAIGENPYAAIAWHSPGPLWVVKLSRLFAAYHWYWKDQPFKVLEVEKQFHVEYLGKHYEGKRDVVVELPDGRRGVVERKTTGDSIAAESNYWPKLRMDVQVGLYAVTLDPTPSFILYDVVKKPGIAPKGIAKIEVTRMLAELKKSGAARYYGQTFQDSEELRFALENAQESVELYGARLTSDIGDRPEFYFARREVPRTAHDFLTLLADIDDQADVLKHAELGGMMHRNPDACFTFGLCEFFGLCSNGIKLDEGDPVPHGFKQREKLHPELD